MNIVPTPWQYFLDVMCDQRIKETETENNPPKLRKVMEYYSELNESEVVFTEPVYHEKRLKPSASYWTVGYTCRPRGYRRDGITFRPLPIEPMVKRYAELASSDFWRIKKPGFYFDQTSNQYHLLIPMDQNLNKALEMTGYRYDPKFYTFEKFDPYHSGLQADGYVKFDYPFLNGRIFVTYIQDEEQVPEPVTELVAEAVTEVAEVVAEVQEKQEVVEQIEAKEEVARQKPYYGKKGRH